jgi:hypothetical protein
MPVLTGGQVLDREGTTVMPDWGGALLEGGLYNVGDHGLIEEAEEPVMGMGPYRYSGVPSDGTKNGIAEKGAYLVNILTGDTYRNTGTKAATVWTADAPSGGGSGAIFLSENNLGDGLLDANETAAVAWADGWTVFNEGGFSVPGGAPTRLALPGAGVYEVFAHGIVAPQVSNELVELVVSIVGEDLGPDFTGAQILALALDGSVPFVWRAFEKLPANALVGVSIQAGTHAAAVTGLHVGIRREMTTA